MSPSAMTARSRYRGLTWRSIAGSSSIRIGSARSSKVPRSWAIGNTLYGNITFKQGRAEQSNFNDYLVARTDITPETHVYFAENDAPPGGVGEPGVPPTGAGDLQRNLCGHRQTDQIIAGRSKAAEGLAIEGATTWNSL